MDGLTTKIISGNKRAVSLAKTLITTPTLINIDPTQGAVFALPLDVETNQKRASAEVSESLIITTSSKQFISDNVAPGSRSWQLSGYIRGIPRLEPSNYFQPFMQLFTDILWNWFNNGAILTFKDWDAHIYTNKVVIKDLQTANQKDSANAVPFTMTLKEINVMQTSVTDLADGVSGDSAGILKSLPQIGGGLGLVAVMGTTTSEVTESVA